MKNYSLLFLFLTLSGTIYGQQNPEKKQKKIMIQEVLVQPGFTLMPSHYGNLQDFKALAPESSILKGDLSKYSGQGGDQFNRHPSFYSFGGPVTNPLFSVLVGLKFAETGTSNFKNNPTLRLGFTYGGASVINSYYSNTQRKTYDTLISPGSGRNAYLDSVNSRSVRMNYSTNQIRFDGSLIFRTVGKSRFSLFTGIGLSAGMNFNASTTINYYKNEYTQARLPNGQNSGYGYYSDYNEENHQSEKFNNKGGFTGSLFVPLGVDLRLANKNEFFKQIHLIFELRPGLNFNAIPELGSNLTPSLQNRLGIRVNWN